ncbi:TniQ family protein [Mesorhizobium sp. M0243]|uniref:TniQ family protein n=1 Tax=Mesorhizobium sp. M0243 TaxID=2956925 RepID=UPI00333B9F9C
MPKHFLPIAPRPFGNELLSRWQDRVACRYGQTAAELELWLDRRTDRPPIGFEKRDFKPADTMIRTWAQACRMAESPLAKMALCRLQRPLAWYLAAHRQAVCPACLREDETGGHDHYVRRSWVHVEALVCARHGTALLDICGRCFSRAGFRFHCVEGKARLICANCSTVVTRVAPDKTSPERMDFLLALCREISLAVDALAPGGNANREGITRAARLLWAPSQANGKPFIMWLDPSLSSGWRGMPSERQAPLATASLAWRTATLIGAARLLDLARARQCFGSPPAVLLTMFSAGGMDVSLRAPGKEELPGEKKPSAKPIGLRSDAEYRVLAEKILTSPEWTQVRSAGRAARDRMLGRLMSQALDRAPRGQAAGHDPAAP